VRLGWWPLQLPLGLQSEQKLSVPTVLNKSCSQETKTELYLRMGCRASFGLFKSTGSYFLRIQAFPSQHA
jgi:hypothetical protein